MNLIDRIKAIRQGGELKRCHTFPIFGEYLNSTHQWNVMMLCHVLFPDARKELLLACATHDVGEVWAFGDVPAHAKWAAPELAREVEALEHGVQYKLIGEMYSLTSEERHILSWLDKLELYIWAVDQVENYGNQRAASTRYRLDGYIAKLGSVCPLPILRVWRDWTATSLDNLPEENDNA
jgi:5'-deoxynucleotidase YfbR-like HD superfamily hydrolase